MPIDYKKYCKDWKLRSRFIRLFRANNKCEVCNIPNHITVIRGKYNGFNVVQDMEGNIYNEKTFECIGGDYLGEVGNNKPIKIILTVAHLDHDIKNNNFFNLKAMCQKCHNNYDVAHRKETKLKGKKQLNLFI